LTKRRRASPPLTESWLRQQAIAYLQRYPASIQRTREVLWRRVNRSAEDHGDNPLASELVENVLAEFVESGALNDLRFAEAWVETLRRRGTSRSMIRSKLFQKGVRSDDIDAALAEEGEGCEQSSAVSYAKRRRLGRYRSPFDDSRERFQKDLASMGRAGFSYGVASDVLRAGGDPQP
jgi:regulatory protein